MRARISMTGAGSAWLQRAVARFLASGGFARHIRRTRTIYRERRDSLVELIEDRLAPLGAWVQMPTGAMNLVLNLPDGVSADSVSSRLREDGIEALPLSFFAIPPDDSTPDALVLGFAGYGVERLAEAVEALRRVLITVAR